jgi:hypothetical protein
MSRLKCLVVLLVCVLIPIRVVAQTTSPTYRAEFQSSADHATVQNQVAILTSYVLQVYAPGGTQLVATRDMGKPIPDATGKIVVDVTSTMNTLPASTNCVTTSPTIATCYSATAKAVGPGGESVSPVSPPFTLVPMSPVAPGRPTVIRP